MPDSNNDPNQKPAKPKGFGIRHLQGILLFAGLTTIVTLRTNLSVGIVAMTGNEPHQNFQTFEWKESINGLLLSSFFWGYVATLIPGSLLTEKFGGKLMYGVSVFGASVFTVLIPLTAAYGWQIIFVMRIMNGLFQGFCYPSLFKLMSKWIHPTERRFSTAILCGNQFGSFLILLVSGQIATSILGWPGIFYISGGCGLLWSILWYWFGSESPANSKSISDEERQYLEQTSGTASNDKLPIPWKHILTSAPVYAAIAAHCANNWGYFTLLAEIPTYMRKVLDYNIRDSALISSLPYLILVVLNCLLGIFSDNIINRGYLQQVYVRKIFTTLAQWVPMLCLIGLGFMTKDEATFAIVLLIVGVGCSGGSNLGFALTYMDMSPNFVSILIGISNFVANIMSLLGPLFVGFIVTDPTDASLWRIFFFVTSALYFVGSSTFLIFGKANIQKWNSDKNNDK